MSQEKQPRKAVDAGQAPNKPMNTSRTTIWNKKTSTTILGRKAPLFLLFEVGAGVGPFWVQFSCVRQKAAQTGICTGNSSRGRPADTKQLGSAALRRRQRAGANHGSWRDKGRGRVLGGHTRVGQGRYFRRAAGLAPLNRNLNIDGHAHLARAERGGRLRTRIFPREASI
ncbi:hypothetical protein BS50DRAFT_3808 [Corynespora cassiicola Philippines]|uniref:Uncharacterized protein n=1 Tax=Corynespora cassiicola Philippines TaxID=1448308 RepID=A0A2T2P8D5_CORCC|nr:hypothetical protein BS50DRAFT_3808 [Corynespora cassiicola Philippines]